MTSVAIGLGCRKDTPAQTIAALVGEALARLPRPPDDVRLYSSERKSHEPGLREAAAALGYELVFLSDSDLAAVAARVVTRSAKVRQVTGLDSVAEAAALAGAGPRARIVVARLIGGGGACAIAAEMSNPGDHR
jgi:cobalt-precorrin 5A hydrolase